MSAPDKNIDLGFLHITPFSPENPGEGLHDAVDLFRYAETLGFQSGWVRTRHLQHGAPAPAVMLTALAAATQRMQLGNAVIPMEFENPFHFAEDFAVADLLSGGRLRPGVSVHPPRFDADTAETIFGGGWDQDDYSYERILKTLDLNRGRKIRDVQAYNGIGGDLDSETVQPLSPGLADRFSYGAGSLRSATWAGANGLGLLTSNISSTENDVREFDEAVAAQIRAYRQARASSEHSGPGRVAVARVVIPTDGASDEQLARWQAYVDARTPRTELVHGEKTIISPDLIGPSRQIVEQLRTNPALALADELIFELPFEWPSEDWRRLLLTLAGPVAAGLRDAGVQDSEGEE
jgi:alkanesulfonate monooxygenase SsuD/methylene tetrahydromethanopterin reductase-like flavin-dependent oxidoreductase (luciferase family)